jgi:hypothetical protein
MVQKGGISERAKLRSYHALTKDTPIAFVCVLVLAGCSGGINNSSASSAGTLTLAVCETFSVQQAEFPLAEIRILG